MGYTGIGKSLFCRSIVQGVDSLALNDEEQLVSVGGPIFGGSRLVFQVSDKVDSCTSTPEFFEFCSNKFLVDCPGIDDSDPTLEFPNVDAIHYIMKYAKSVQILLLIDFAQLKHKRGTDFIRGLAKFVSLLSEEGVKNAKNFVTPIITRADFKKNGEKVLSGLKTNIDNFIGELLKAEDRDQMLRRYFYDKVTAQKTYDFFMDSFFESVHYCDCDPDLKGTLNTKCKNIGIEVEALAQKLQQSDAPATSATWFAADLPCYLEASFQHYFDQHLRHSEEMETSLNFRNDVQTLIKEALREWTGERAVAF